jgi:hypothetical protein
MNPLFKLYRILMTFFPAFINIQGQRMSEGSESTDHTSLLFNSPYLIIPALISGSKMMSL